MFLGRAEWVPRIGIDELQCPLGGQARGWAKFLGRAAWGVRCALRGLARQSLAMDCCGVGAA